MNRPTSFQANYIQTTTHKGLAGAMKNMKICLVYFLLACNNSETALTSIVRGTKVETEKSLTRVSGPKTHLPPHQSFHVQQQRIVFISNLLRRSDQPA